MSQFHKTFPAGSPAASAMPRALQQREISATPARGPLVSRFSSSPMRWADRPQGRCETSSSLPVTSPKRRRPEAPFRQPAGKNAEGRAARHPIRENLTTTIAPENDQPLAAITNCSMGCVRQLRSPDTGTKPSCSKRWKRRSQAGKTGEQSGAARCGPSSPARAANLDPDAAVNEVVSSDRIQSISLEARQGGTGFAQALACVPARSSRSLINGTK